MAHTCFGEYCMITGRWDCPNRSDREEADKRTPEEIERAQAPTKAYLRDKDNEIKKELEGKLGFIEFIKGEL